MTATHLNIYERHIYLWTTCYIFSNKHIRLYNHTYLWMLCTFMFSHTSVPCGRSRYWWCVCVRRQFFFCFSSDRQPDASGFQQKKKKRVQDILREGVHTSTIDVWEGYPTRTRHAIHAWCTGYCITWTIIHRVRTKYSYKIFRLARSYVNL